MKLIKLKKYSKSLVESGERYDVDEIEFWFENEGSWKIKEPRVQNYKSFKLCSR